MYNYNFIIDIYIIIRSKILLVSFTQEWHNLECYIGRL